MEKFQVLYARLKEHKNILKIAVTVMIILAAFLFFGKNGENDEIQIDKGENSEAPLEEQPEKESTAEIYVDISGEVKTPGVYQVKNGTRLFQVVELAGGLKTEADTDGFNQAEIVSDGQKIIIPVKGATLESTSPQQEAIGNLININSADSAALQEIPGVGPATADKIITYRLENGKFTKKEDLKNVSGIGDKTYDKMKDMITI